AQTHGRARRRERLAALASGQQLRSRIESPRRSAIRSATGISGTLQRRRRSYRHRGGPRPRARRTLSLHDALLVGGRPFYWVQAPKIIERIERAGLVAVHAFREFTEVGGLVSYGTNIANTYRQVGIYAGRILKGAKPADLPVLQPT